MPKSEHVSQAASTKQASHQKEPSFTHEQTPQGAGSTYAHPGLMGRHTLLEKQQHYLAHPGIAIAQRRQLASKIHALHGNAHLQRVIKQATRKSDHSILQRDPETATAESEQAGTEQADPELDALLEEIFGKTPQIPAFEAITSTTAGEFSRGELEDEIQRLWRRQRLSFTAAARHAAERNTAGRDGPRATQSLQIQPEVAYTARWAVNLFAFDYQGRGDLPEIAELMQRGSPFQRALDAEFNRVIPVENPTGSEIHSQIFNAIHDMWLSLGDNQTGELVISFSGHGGNGSISGVDWAELSPSELDNLASMARDFNIHVIYILDTCRAGLLANFAHAAAVRDIEERTATLPEEQRAPQRLHIEQLRRLGRLGTNISGMAIGVGDADRAYRRHQTDATYLVLFEWIMALSRKASELGDYLQQPNAFLATLPNLATLQRQQFDVALAAIVAADGNRRTVRQALRSTAVLLDEINTALNAAIANIMAQESGAQGGRSPIQGAN